MSFSLLQVYISLSFTDEKNDGNLFLIHIYIYIYIWGLKYKYTVKTKKKNEDNDWNLVLS